MAKLNEKQKLAVLGGVVLLLCGVGVGGVWWSKGLSEAKRALIAGMRTEIGDAEAKIAKIPVIEQDVIILRENLYEYVKILPEEQELNNFLRISNQFKLQAGVAMRLFQPGRETNNKKSAFSRWTYKFELTGTLWQFLQFMSYFENYRRFIQVKNFALSSGQSSRAGEDVVHTITMVLESYTYTGSGNSKDVAIRNYSDKVERLREEIFEARQTISSQGYEFQGPRGRRDIFIDPRESSMSRPIGIAAGPSPRDQKRLIDDTRIKLTECQEIFRRLQDKSITIFDRYSLERQLRDQLDQLDKEVEDMNVKGYISHTPLKLAWTREIIEPLIDLRRNASPLNRPPEKGLPEREMRNLLAAMSDDLRAGEIVAAIERYDTVEERMQVDKDDHRHSLRMDIESLYIRAKLADEFSGLRIEISGLCVNDRGKSGIILNGIVYQEGEYVDNNLLIKGVARDRIEFVYKGFTVVRTL